MKRSNNFLSFAIISIFFSLLFIGLGCSCDNKWKTVSVDELRVEVEQKTHPNDQWGYVGTSNTQHHFIKYGHDYIFPKSPCQQRRFCVDSASLEIGSTYPFRDSVKDSQIRWIFSKWNAAGTGFIFSLAFLDAPNTQPSTEIRKGEIRKGVTTD